MKSIAALQGLVTRLPHDLEPSDAELDAIELEMPEILADLAGLDLYIKTLDRPVNDLDGRRVRRARNRGLAERRNLTNRVATVLGGAA
ncbi:DUF6284 family protein [Streptomyces sp. NBC_01268]|uniref:DUF6284 family protein n=1 Tax=Streptomyces sp. NBC_01268 TaxID=2903806 RepID=UPI002E32F508|nr:DUF6284 family protein [Streptomyces sp. NBC_01268]